MERSNRVIRIFTFILAFSSFLLAPVNIAFAADAPADKSAPQADKKSDKKKADAKGGEKAKGEKGKKGKDGEEPECE